MNILITGDSHTAALKLGLDDLTAQKKLPIQHSIIVKPIGRGDSLAKNFFSDEGDHVAIFNETKLRTANPLPKVNRLPVVEQAIDWYGLCAPLNSIRLWRNQAWRYYTPLFKKTDKIPVSNSLVRQLVLQDVQYSLQMLEILQRIGVNVFVIEAPKPYRHHRINKIIGDELVLYLDKFYRQLVRNWLADHNIPIVALPDNCYDANGFMSEQFRNEKDDDQHHANQAFGVMMLEEIIKFAEHSEL